MGVWIFASFLLFCTIGARCDGPSTNRKGLGEAGHPDDRSPAQDVQATASWRLVRIYDPQATAQSAVPLPAQHPTQDNPDLRPILKKNDEFEPYEPPSYYPRPGGYHQQASVETYGLPQLQLNTYYTPEEDSYAAGGVEADASAEDVAPREELSPGNSRYGEISLHGHKESKKEVHYHQHKHLHEHDHKQEHVHKHQSHHKHQQKHEHKHHQEHKHDHDAHHGHKHHHDHDHGHQHHHGHKHENHHVHKHHQKHEHQHHQHHKHQHHADHKHGHKHDHHNKHGHHHKHEHDQHHQHGHKAHHHHKHHEENQHKHHHKHEHHAKHKHDSHHKHKHVSVHSKW